jgi:hypothetical protein
MRSLTNDKKNIDNQLFVANAKPNLLMSDKLKTPGLNLISENQLRMIKILQLINFGINRFYKLFKGMSDFEKDQLARTNRYSNNLNNKSIGLNNKNLKIFGDKINNVGSGFSNLGSAANSIPAGGGTGGVDAGDIMTLVGGIGGKGGGAAALGGKAAAAAGTVALVAYAANLGYGAYKGWNNAHELVGKKPENVTTKDKISAASATLLSHATLGFIDPKTIYDWQHSFGGPKHAVSFKGELSEATKKQQARYEREVDKAKRVEEAFDASARTSIISISS